MLLILIKRSDSTTETFFQLTNFTVRITAVFCSN